MRFKALEQVWRELQMSAKKLVSDKYNEIHWFPEESYYILKKEDESSMDIRDYEYIVTIAEQKSITRAAAQLFITQSALTKFLQRTERSLGVALFLKKGNQFLLTEAGQ